MGSSFSNPKCDVFLSFRGKDTGDGFTSYLYTALKRKEIRTYIDDKLKKGDEISPVISKAIKKAKLSVIVFSENYASSSRCLNELVQILECREKEGQIVVPIFYHVEPSDVREQKGSYTITSESIKGGEHKVDAWKVALSKASNLSGWDSRSIGSESKLIEEIVKDIEKRLGDQLGAATSAAVMTGVVGANMAAASIAAG